MTLRFSPNIDLLFTELSEIPDRITAAADAGFDAVELWGTADRALQPIHDVALDRGIEITSILAEPRTNITFPGTDLNAYYDSIVATVDRARALECERVVVSGGTGFMGMKRPAQLQKVIEIFTEIVSRTEGSGVTFVLEPLNVRVDHPGALFDRTRDAIDVARAVDSERFGILYDLYHSITEGEDPATELAEGAAVIRYMQVADVPGRGEPGTGGIDWPTLLGVVEASEYSGPIGLEFFPTTPTTDAVEFIRRFA